MYKYLKSINEVFDGRFQRGSCKKTLDLEIFNNFKLNLPSKEIQDNIVQCIVNKQFVKKMVVIELDTVKDIYFDGISKYDELALYPSQYKRVLVEMEGIYPETEKQRIKFEDKLLNRKQANMKTKVTFNI